jgi:3-carboxy-cis,cis-muconate cycloisomerase
MSYTLAMSQLHRAMFGDADVLKLFSADDEVTAIVQFEVALAKAQESCGFVPVGTAEAVAVASKNLSFDDAKFEKAVAQDGVAIPAIVAYLKSAVGPAFAEHVHQGATSQDVIDTALMMQARSAVGLVRKNLAAQLATLTELLKNFGQRTLMGRTRMQRALPMTVGDRLKVWQHAIAQSEVALSQLVFPVQFSGPIGIGNDAKVKTLLAADLGLAVVMQSWQTDRLPVLALGNACVGMTGALGKIGADVSLMMQNEIAEIKLRGGGSSSAMPHKQNPVKAEILVALARWNATLLSGLHQAAVHEQERSGAAWTLEWLALPQMICATASAARLGRELFDSVESVGA